MKFCTQCGTACEDDALFCCNCGNRFQSAPAPQTQPAAEPQPAAAEPVIPAYAAETSAPAPDPVPEPTPVCCPQPEAAAQPDVTPQPQGGYYQPPQGQTPQGVPPYYANRPIYPPQGGAYYPPQGAAYAQPQAAAAKPEPNGKGKVGSILGLVGLLCIVPTFVLMLAAFYNLGVATEVSYYTTYLDSAVSCGVMSFLMSLIGLGLSIAGTVLCSVGHRSKGCAIAGIVVNAIFLFVTFIVMVVIIAISAEAESYSYSYYF